MMRARQRPGPRRRWTLGAAGLAAAALALDLARAQGVSSEELVVVTVPVLETAADVGARSTDLGRGDVAAGAETTLDDWLRDQPSFGVFRRSSSLVANPTTEGVSLRGLGGTATSRALVLVDGMPLNDPFGGWVDFARVPVATVERVAILPGATPRPWSTDGLGGVIAIDTDPGTKTPSTRLTVQGGTQATGALNLAIRNGAELPGLGLVVDLARTDGWVTAAHGHRGAIDVAADSQHGLFDGRATVVERDGLRWTLGGSYFTEQRGNGTPLTDNSTEIGSLRTRAVLDDEATGRWEVTGYAQLQSFASRFTAQARDRSSETPSLDQFDVPSNAWGASGVWSGRIGEWNELHAGLHRRDTAGSTHEDFGFVDGAFTRRRVAGGTVTTSGGFAEDTLSFAGLGRLELGTGIDRWASEDGHREETDLVSGSATRDERFDSRDEWLWTPRVGVSVQAAESLTLRGAVYRTARTPTLNELHRPFRVGNDVTEANAHLTSERLTGGEVGADLSVGAIVASATASLGEIEDPITNVTLGFGPGAIEPCGGLPAGGTCRQRQNLGRSEIRGLELEATTKLTPGVSMRVGYRLADTEVMVANRVPSLVGKRLAQVPLHRGVAELRIDGESRMSASMTTRIEGRQFEDDLNQRPLAGYLALDAVIGFAVSEELRVAIRGSNLTAHRAEVGKSAAGLVTIGEPLLILGGIEARL